MDPSRRRATLAAVAAAVGVSRTTVSNAYNRPDQLSATLRKRILAAAAELGYHGPDPVARSLRMRTASAVGLVFGDSLSRAFVDPNAVEFLQGVARACEDTGRSLLLVPAGPEATNTETVQRAAVDGFVVYSLPPNDRHLAAVRTRPQPIVIVDSPRDVPDVDFVGVDDRVGFAKITRHVLGLGHRRIAFLVSSVTGVWSDAPDLVSVAERDAGVLGERARGMQDEVGAADVQVSVWDCRASAPDLGAAAAREALAAEPRPTAVVCFSDALALGALQTAADLGLRVPEDVSVTGFDDVPAAAAAGLTTVRQPTPEKGRRAVALLDKPAVDGRRVVQLPTKLIVRGSTGPAGDE
jgi:DNA-binding LacI/PurR family transcriptional regulator